MNTSEKIFWTERKIESRTRYDSWRKVQRLEGFDALVVYIKQNVLCRIDINREYVRYADLILTGRKDEAVENIVRQFDNTAYDWLKPGRRDEVKETVRAAFENIWTK